jgi:hypothetical protein
MTLQANILLHDKVTKQWAYLFRLLAASGHQKLLRTAKLSAFQPASIKFVGAKTIQNQHKHIICWVVVIVGICHFLDPEPYEQLYLPLHVIVIILRFSPQPDFQKSWSEKSWTKQAQYLDGSQHLFLQPNHKRQNMTTIAAPSSNVQMTEQI